MGRDTAVQCGISGTRGRGQGSPSCEANPLLASTGNPQRKRGGIPLEAAAGFGHLGVVCELIQQLGIEGCGGASGGVDALHRASLYQRVDVMTVLMDAGVVDTGIALVAAAGSGGETSVKFLLKRQEGKTTDGVGYVNNTLGLGGSTPLLSTINVPPGELCYRRIARLLIDDGADTTSAVRVAKGSQVFFKGTPLAYATTLIRQQKAESGGKDTTEEQRGRLEGVRRLLLQVEAVHAVSWLWPSAAHAVDGASRSKRISTPLRMMLPRQKPGTRRVLVVTLFRYGATLTACSWHCCICWVLLQHDTAACVVNCGQLLLLLLLLYVVAVASHYCCF